MKWLVAIHCMLLFSITVADCYYMHPIIALIVTALAAMVLFSYLMINAPGRTRNEIIVLFGLYMAALVIYLMGSGLLMPGTVLETVLEPRHIRNLHNSGPMPYRISRLVTAYMMLSWLIVLAIIITALRRKRR
ncbi:MAG: hypothetical protein P9M14_13505 [Candidatus Alcyoniella australis]|nr:hypothetical protein [Candidatus Alcyoniella australis]